MGGMGAPQMGGGMGAASGSPAARGMGAPSSAMFTPSPPGGVPPSFSSPRSDFGGGGFGGGSGW